MPPPSFTPRQVALSLGVSESSLKRWCDRGLVPVQRTVGGHRRIPMHGIVQLLRRQTTPLVAPEAVGLPRQTRRSAADPSCAVDRLRKSLIEDDANATRRTVLELYLSGHSIARICDELIQPALVAIGEGWALGEIQVYEEHRAFEVIMRLLHELQFMLPPIAVASPIAIGCSTPGDCYALPTRMAELALREGGWNAASLGSSLPFESLKQAIRKYDPQLVWLSSSVIEDEHEYVAGVQSLGDQVAVNRKVIVGGRALTAELIARMKRVTYCAGLKRLVEVAGEER